MSGGDYASRMAHVETAREGAVLTITLNRPEVLNAIDRSLQAGLRAALGEARDPAIRAVVITGAGRGFCVGQDLAELKEITSATEHIRENYHPTVLAIRALEKPVLAAVNGPVAGAGLSLALACDHRIAAADATFVPGFIGIGLAPDSGATHFLTRLLGPSRAFTWLASNRALSAEEAYAWGLVDEVVEADAFPAAVRERASAYAAAPTSALGLTKRLLDRAATAPLAEQLELEAELQGQAATTADFGEGVAAFLEKRPPNFTGR